MAVVPGSVINAYQYNILQNRVKQILGNGFGNIGYGQSLKSQEVVPPSSYVAGDSDTITAEQWNNLRDDLEKAYLHQNGVELPIPPILGSQDDPSQGDIVGAQSTSTGAEFDNKEVIQTENVNFNKGYNNFERFIESIQDNRFKIDPTQSSSDELYIDTRTFPFNGLIVSQFRLNFASADSRRHFFNAGGEISFIGTVSNSGSPNSQSYQRNEGWSDLITNVGKIILGYNDISLPNNPTNGITESDLGNYDLTDQYQILIKKEAGGGIYGNSYWQIEGRNFSQSSIEFKISIVDQGPEGGGDTQVEIDDGIVAKEAVTADIDFTVEGKRADGSVVTDYPSIQKIKGFDD